MIKVAELWSSLLVMDFSCAFFVLPGEPALSTWTTERERLQSLVAELGQDSKIDCRAALIDGVR